MKRIASIQDISCLGRCSLTVALPVISAMAVECAIVPTAVLSTHTMFPGFISRDLSDQLLPIARHWKSQNVTLDAICTGYLASPRQTEEVCDFFDLLAGPDTLLFVDPAMADGGRLYSGFGPDFPAYMRRVVSRAHVAVPNVTEACLLTDTPYRETEDLSWWRDLLRRVGDLGPRCPVLTGVPFGPDRLGVMALDPESGGIFQYHTPPGPRPLPRHRRHLLRCLRRGHGPGQKPAGGSAPGGGFHPGLYSGHLPGPQRPLVRGGV